MNNDRQDAADEPQTPSQSKKRRVQADPDDTPRPIIRPSDSASQAPSSLSTSSFGSLSSSRNSSPSKQMAQLEVENPLELYFAKFNDPAKKAGEIPPGLQETRKRLAPFWMRDHKIIPLQQRAAAELLLQDLLIPIDDEAYYTDDEPRRYGKIVPLNKIKNIVANTARCTDLQAAEAVWNAEVHHQILRYALREDDECMGDGLVNFSSCTSARIHRHSLARHSSLVRPSRAKMVDYCICIQPDTKSDTKIDAAIRRLRSQSTSGTVNHTDYSIFRNYPVALSIETKNQDGSEGAATLQLGTWHAAHWNFLSQHVREGGLETLAFLPGLFVQGARWYFLASTRSNDKTTIWSTDFVGATDSEIGTFRVIRTIQYLAWWCADVYWPWFRKNVLGLEDEQILRDQPT